MTRQQRRDRAKRVQQQHEQLRGNTHVEFGRKPYRCSQEMLANRRAAILFALLAALSLAGALYWNQPVLALAAVIFLTTAVLVVKDA